MKITQARRIALGAQQMGRDRDRAVTARQVQSIIDSIAQFQIDSVNVLARAHLMPLYTRLGSYGTDLLARAASPSGRRLFEYWGHAASLIDISLFPALRFRMQEHSTWRWQRLEPALQRRPNIIDETLAVVSDHGPLTPRDLEDDQARTRGGWWNWSENKSVMEWLFSCGKISVRNRNPQFERIFDLTTRIIPTTIYDTPEMDIHDSHVALVRRAAKALGIGTANCLGDYFRTRPAPTRAAIAELEASGELERVEVEGWKDPAWVWAGARNPRRIQTAALVSPFDSLVFERRRLKALFGTDYTISLYTPADKRVHGYYVYLFLLDEQFVARVDLKADRKNKMLLVQSAWLEDEAEPRREAVASELARELRRTASWLHLDDIQIANKGSLSASLRSAERKAST